MPKAKRKSAAAPIWRHSASGRGAARDAALAVAYCAGRDVASRPMADAALLPFDLMTNRAHCAMLRGRRIISARQFAAIARGLAAIERRVRAGKFKLNPALEDVHINIERAVAEISGEAAAGVMHTARSRNDQTTTDVRLWLRETLLGRLEALGGTISALAGLAAREANTIMAGWTHGQPAMPTTLGHWAAAHGFALSRDAQALANLWPLVNQSPLGAAAGFGSSWPIHRAAVAQWLGFDSAQRNSLDCVSTRWEMEARLGFALAMTMTHLSSLGQDLIFLSSPPRRLVALAPAFTTGSSIMPQKRNPDFAEVTRARAAAAHALLAATLAAGRGALSGYNRDSQWTKYWIMDLADEMGAAPEVFARAVATLKPDRAALARTASEDFVQAVDLADRIGASRKVPFRAVYHAVGRAVERGRARGAFDLKEVNEAMREAGIAPPLRPAEFARAIEPRRAVEERRSPGGPAPKDVAAQARELAWEAGEIAKWAARRRAALARADRELRAAIKKLSR